MTLVDDRLKFVCTEREMRKHQFGKYLNKSFFWRLSLFRVYILEGWTTDLIAYNNILRIQTQGFCPEKTSSIQEKRKN